MRRAHAQRTPARTSWARLVKRGFDIDIDDCPDCGGALKIIAAIEDPPVIIKILSHLGLPTRAPPRAGSPIRSIPNDLNKAKPPANASRWRRSLGVRPSGSLRNLSRASRPLSGRAAWYNSGFFIKQKRN